MLKWRILDCVREIWIRDLALSMCEKVARKKIYATVNVRISSNFTAFLGIRITDLMHRAILRRERWEKHTETGSRTYYTFYENPDCSRISYLFAHFPPLWSPSRRKMLIIMAHVSEAAAGYLPVAFNRLIEYDIISYRLSDAKAVSFWKIRRADKARFCNHSRYDVIYSD